MDGHPGSPPPSGQGPDRIPPTGRLTVHRTIPDRRARVWLRSDERPKGCRHRSPLPKERSVTNALPVPATDRKGGRPNLGRTHKAGANPLTSGQTDQSLAVGGSIAPQRLCPFLSFRATAVAAEERGRGGPPPSEARNTPGGQRGAAARGWRSNLGRWRPPDIKKGRRRRKDRHPSPPSWPERSSRK